MCFLKQHFVSWKRFLIVWYDMIKFSCTTFFSSPELITWAFRLIGELIVSIAMVPRPSIVVHHFQSSSSPKPLGLSKPIFIWSLSGMGERIFICGVWVTWPRRLLHPYIVKTLQKSSFPESKGQWPCGLVAFGTWAHHDLFKWWP